MKTLLFILQLFLFSVGFSQITEDFSDGDITTNPTWSGTVTDFVVNSNFELQSNLAISATSFLSVPHGLSTLDDKEWRFRVKMSFSPSASNFGRIYLVANGADPTTNPDGFYLQLGEALTTDAVRLFKQVGGISTQICAGASGQIATSFNFGIKITRDNTGFWSLFTDATGGTNYVLEASGTDAQNLLGTHFSWQCVYTSSNANKFYLDDIYVGNIVVDIAAPVLLSVSVVGQSVLDILFNEPINQTIAEDPNNFDLQPFNSFTSAVLDGVNPKLVHLTTATPMMNGNSYTLFALNMQDLVGNDSLSQSFIFTYLVGENPLPGDVIVNEVFADPTPSVGLPELEFVEIFNRSNKYFNLSNWKLGDASADGTIGGSFIAPGEYKILCATSSVAFYPGAVDVASFPSLNNAGDNVVLKDSNGVVLDKISYSDTWYQDAIKQDGGFTLERINPTLVCSSETNWIASNSILGGTPGQQNSVFSNTPDTDAPTLKSILVEAPNKLTILFNEPLDSIALVNSIVAVQPILVETNRSISTSQPISVDFWFSPDFAVSSTYQISLQGIADCAGNSTTLSAEFILPDVPVEADVVINEILFDPLTGGSDYVELYNQSEKVVDLFDWHFANIIGDSVANLKSIQTHFLLYPNEYVVVSKDTNQVKMNYTYHGAGRFVQSDLPSYSNDSGTVVLLNNGTILDRVSYLADWHFSLLDNNDGKSLERINSEDLSNLADNWHTAAESFGFGTPGRENSQFVPTVSAGEFTLPSKVLSPDNDGFEDVLQIRYKMNETDLLANLFVYDEYGRLIRKLKENEYLATEGLFTWDGVNKDGNKASIGQYILVFEVFRPNGGMIFVDKKTCILAGKI
ncbi:MAG: lamin tail domain-containing protein [Crocinitomicaceae bacterium]